MWKPTPSTATSLPKPRRRPRHSSTFSPSIVLLGGEPSTSEPGRQGLTAGSPARTGSRQLGRRRERLLEGGQAPDAAWQGGGSPAGPAGGHERGPGPGPRDRGQLVVVGGRR